MSTKLKTMIWSRISGDGFLRCGGVKHYRKVWGLPSMRVERKGQVPPLTPRWKAFVTEALKGVDLDALQSAEVMRADYACLSGLIALELKTLEEDGAARMDNLMDELSQRPDWPQFYGSAPLESMLKHVEDPDAVRRKFINRVGRAIINHLKKANKQLGAHANNLPRKNLLRVMLLINEDHELYDPSLVAHILKHALRRRDHSSYLYPNVDFVLFTSERHAASMNDQLTFPLVSIEGPGLETSVWKRGVMDEVFARWSAWNDNPIFYADALNVDFSTIEHVSDQMPRHELWRLEYRRNPYMRFLLDDELRAHFDEAQVILMLMALKDAPLKPQRDMVQSAMMLFTHITMEMNNRGISALQFKLVPKRLAEAADRIGMPAQVQKWYLAMQRL